MSTSKPNSVVIRIHGLKRKLTPETYGQDEFSHDFCFPGDTLVENLGKEISKEIPDLKEYRDFIAHGGKRESIEHNWVDKFTSRVEVTHGRPCANPKKGFKINIDQPIAAFFGRAYPRPLQALRKSVLPNASGYGDLKPTVSSDSIIEFGRDMDVPDLAISFMRTARLPWCDETYQLPPASGSFPLFDVQKFAGRMTDSMATQGGIFMPIYQMEAMWINFVKLGHETCTKFAVRPFVGGVNTISGQALHCATMDAVLPKKRLLSKKQDYLVSPDQKRLDGTSVEPGVVRQFVATEMVSASRKDYLAAKEAESEDGRQDERQDKETPAGASVEWQVTGNDEFGGLQLQIIPTHDVQSMHAGSEENNLFLRGEGSRRYDVLKTPREHGLVAGNIIHIKDLKSVLPRRRKTLSDLVDELPADGPAGRDGIMTEIEVAGNSAILETFDIKEQGDGGSKLSLQFDTNEEFQKVEAVMISKMGYQDSNVLIFCVWKRRNRKPGIVRVQSWGDVRSGTPRIEPQTGQASSRKIWDIITVPIGSTPESDYILEVGMAPWNSAEHTKATTPARFCMILSSESTMGHLRGELQQFLGPRVDDAAFKVAGRFWVFTDTLDDDVQLKTAEPKAGEFVCICRGASTIGRIDFLAGPGVDSSKACRLDRGYRDDDPLLGDAGQMGLAQSFPYQDGHSGFCRPKFSGADYSGHSELRHEPYYAALPAASYSPGHPAAPHYHGEVSHRSDDRRHRHHSRRRDDIQVQHEDMTYNIDVPPHSREQNVWFVKLRLFALTGIQPRHQVLQSTGRPLADTWLLNHFVGGPTLSLTTQPPTCPAALGVGAGGKIEQHIEPDYDNPRIWDVGSSKILNVQLLDAHTFKTVTGQDPPPTPLSPERYAELGLAFEKAWRDELKGPGVSGRAEDGTWGGVSSLQGPMEVAAGNAGVQIPAADELDSGEGSSAGPGLGAVSGGFFETAADFPVLLEDVDDTVSQFKSAMEADVEDDWSD